MSQTPKTDTHAWMPAGRHHTYMHPSIHSWTHACMHTYIQRCTHTHTEMCRHIHSYMHRYIHTPSCGCNQVECSHRYKQINIREYVHPYIRTFMHAQVHPFMHAYLLSDELPLCDCAAGSDSLTNALCCSLRNVYTYTHTYM